MCCDSSEAENLPPQPLAEQSVEEGGSLYGGVIFYLTPMTKKLRFTMFFSLASLFPVLVLVGCGGCDKSPAPLSKPEPEQEQTVDAKFNIYGTWEYVATPSSPEEWSEVPPTITIGTNDTLSLAIWERYYTGIMSKTDTHIRVHSLSGWADGEEFAADEKEWTLTYNPETDLIRIVCGSWHTGYYRRASDLDAEDNKVLFADEARSVDFKE
jgi:hypothetical protein